MKDIYIYTTYKDIYIPQLTSYSSNASHAVLLLYFSYNNNTGSLWESVSSLDETGYFWTVP